MATVSNKLSVENMLTELKNNPSKRFSKTDFQNLIYAILMDDEYMAKTYLTRANGILEEGKNYRAAMLKFLDKLLKHAGMSDSSERQKVLNTFEFGYRDVEWIADAVDEATYQYVEAGKNMRVFRDKLIQLTLKKAVRTGKQAGKITYKRTINDRTGMLNKIM